MEVTSGLKISGGAIAINLLLAVVKIATGIVGHSSALVADGIESTTDIFSSVIVWSGLRVSVRPPDHTHPYGHGKAESVAAIVVSLFLLGAALLIAVQSVHHILTPHPVPEWYTLAVLAAVVVSKEALFRKTVRIGDHLSSSALVADAWHHRSDAITSLAASVGIAIALIGGEGYEGADDWAALLACSIIVYNGVHLFRSGLDEVMDAAVDVQVERQIRTMTTQVEGVIEVEKCRIRKSGPGLLTDLHVVVDGDLSVRCGHEIAHAVKDRLLESALPISDVIIHIEPDAEKPAGSGPG